MAMPKAPPAVTPLTGDETVRVIQTGKLALAKASDLKGPKGDKGEKGDKGDQGLKGDAGAASTVPGPKGDPGAPLRVETYTATSNTSGIATFTWPAFTVAPVILTRPGWASDQYIGGGIASGPTLTGCTMLVKRSRGTLLLTSGPFETAPSTALTIIVIGR